MTEGMFMRLQYKGLKLLKEVDPLLPMQGEGAEEVILVLEEK